MLAIGTTLSNSNTSTRQAKGFLSESSIKFDGTDDFVQFALPTVFNAIGSNDFSVSLWFNADNLAKYSVYTRLFEAAYDANNFVQFNIGEAGKPRFNVKDGGTQYASAVDAVLNTGQWYHMVGVWDASENTATLYLDGVLQSGGAGGLLDAGWGGVQNAFLGCRGGASGFTDGSFDEVSIFSSALTAREVDALYNNGQPTNLSAESNLAHWFRMGEGKLDDKSDGDSNLLFDQGPNGGLSSEKITNGDFSDASVPDTWNGSAGENLAGWAAYGPGHTASAHVTITNGAARIRSDGTYAAISQSVLSSGASYKYSIDVTDATSGSIQLYGGAVLLATINSAGTYSGYWTSTDSNPFYIKRSSSPVDVTFDNVSVREVQNVGTINGALIKDESTAESVPKKTQNLPSAGSAKSLSFDGTDDQVLLPVALPSTFTLSFWFKQTDTANGEYLFDSRNSGSDAWAAWTTGTGPHTISVWNGATHAGSAQVPVNTWAHVVITVEGQYLNLYVNGEHDGAKSGYGGTTTSDIKIGSRYSGANYWAGNLDEVAIWDTALDSEAVKALYNAGQPTPVTTKTGAYDIYRDNLKAYYKMGDATNPAADGTSSRVNTHLFDQTNPGVGSELSVADPYTLGRWGGLGTNDPTFVAGESVRIDRPASGGDSAGGYVYLTDDSSGFLTEDLVATKVYKLTLLFETDDSNALVQVTGGGGHHQSSVGSGVKTFYMFGLSGAPYMTFAGLDNGKFLKVSQLSVKPVNGNTGTISGATIQTESPKQIYALPPVANTKSIIFDGTNDYLVTQVDATAQPNNESRYYSWWYKSPSPAGSKETVFSHGAENRGMFAFDWSSNRNLLYMASSVLRYWNSNSKSSDNAWHHWVLRIKYNAIEECELWCDGEKQTVNATTNSGSMNIYTSGITIGAGLDNSRYLEGNIDSFSIHEDLGSNPDEAVRALFNRGRPIDISKSQGAYESDKALHWWRMGDATNDGTNDIILQGLEAESDELITDGGFDDPSAWNATGSAVVSDGIGNFPNSTNSFLIKTAVLSAGNLVRTYKLQFDVLSTNGAALQMSGGSSAFFQAALPTADVGTKTVFLTSDGGGLTQLAFHNNAAFVGSIDNVSLKQVRGQYSGPELFKADADLYQASTWTSYGDNVETFPNGTAVRFTSPASGGHVAGGTTTLRSGSGVYALTENMETGYVYKLSFDFLTDDADAFPRYYSGSGYTNISAGSGFKVLYFVPTGSGGVAINVDALSANKFVQFSNLSLTKIGGAAVLTNMDSASDIQTDTPY